MTALLLVVSNQVHAEPPQGPGLGQAITKQEIARWDIGVMPDGTGLPPGQGTVNEGKTLYENKCISCHGENGLGNSGDQLAGAIHALTDEYPEKTIGTYWPYATTLFDFTRRSMPMTLPGSLSNDETYALVAYMLYLNGIVTEDTVMNAKVLREIKMPNRDGFINVYEQNRKNKCSF
ncbi:MAG: cytochrome c [Thiotrichales bacterium]|nr:cytochrome c [Thiotrichales bacterium]